MINCSPLQPDKGANITASGPVTVIISALSEEERTAGPPADLNLRGNFKKKEEVGGKRKGTKHFQHQQDKYQPGVPTCRELDPFVMHNTGVQIQRAI